MRISFPQVCDYLNDWQSNLLLGWIECNKLYSCVEGTVRHDVITITARQSGKTYQIDFCPQEGSLRKKKVDKNINTM